MGHLFEAGAETRRQKFNVIGEQFSRLLEAAIGHHQGAGEIIGERHAQQFAGDLVGPLKPRNGLVQKPVELGQGQLVSGLKGPPRLIHHLGDHQLLAMVVVPAQAIAHHFEGQGAHANAMARPQIFDEGGEKALRILRQGRGEGFGRLVEVGKMIARLLEDAAHLLDRAFAEQGLGAVAVAAGKDARLARLARGRIGAVKAQHGGKQGRRMLGGVAHLGARDRGVAKQRVGEDLLHVADRLLALDLHEVARIDAIDVGEPDQHLHRDRALIALHQVEIAGRNIEFVSHARLGEPAFPAQALEPGTGENLPWR